MAFELRDTFHQRILRRPGSRMRIGNRDKAAVRSFHLNIVRAFHNRCLERIPGGTHTGLIGRFRLAGSRSSKRNTDMAFELRDTFHQRILRRSDNPRNGDSWDT